MNSLEEWLPHAEIDFSDLSILQYNIDTRDFHCICGTELRDKQGKPKSYHFAKLDKQPDMFYHTADEMKALIERMFIESGGENEWRFLSLEGNSKASNEWFKYMRIRRFEKGLIVFNDSDYALSKEVLSNKINQEHLDAHTLKRMK